MVILSPLSKTEHSVSLTIYTKSESMNSRIQKVKARSHGFRNRERFRNAIYFHLGALGLYPATSQTGLACAAHTNS